jgi:hypothetical protein
MMNLDAVHLSTMVDTLVRAAKEFDNRMPKLSPYNGKVHDDAMRCHRLLIGMAATLEKHRMAATMDMVRNSDPRELAFASDGRRRLNTIPETPVALRESDKPPVSA